MSEPQPYDFAKPGRLTAEAEQRAAAWLRAAAALAVKKAVKHLPAALEVTFLGLEVDRPADGLGILPDSAVGFAVSLNADQPGGLIALPRPLALALIGGMLGDAPAALPDDRDLTVVEQELAQFFVQDVLVGTLQETWPAAESIPFKMRRREPHPKWSRVFPPDDNTVVCTFAVKGPFGDSGWHVLLSQKHLLEQFALTSPGADKTKPAAPPLPAPRKLRLLAEELPVDVTVVVGTAEVSLTELARLSAGDVIILNQRVSDPLPAYVSGEKKFRAWAGRVGSRQAVEIESFEG